MTYNTIKTAVATTKNVKVTVVDMVCGKKIGEGYVVSARVHAANGTATVSEYFADKEVACKVLEKLTACKGSKVGFTARSKVENTYENSKYVNFYGKFSL